MTPPLDYRVSELLGHSCGKPAAGIAARLGLRTIVAVSKLRALERRGLVKSYLHNDVRLWFKVKEQTC